MSELPKDLVDMKEVYNFWLSTPSNIQKELEVIHRYTLECKHITEFGFGMGKSGSAILAARPEVYISYDIKEHWHVGTYKDIIVYDYVDFRFILGSSIVVEIEPTEMLFIDSHHTFDHLTQELNKHHSKVSKYILIHDIRSHGYKGEDGSSPGYFQAVRDFISNHKQWCLKELNMSGSGIVVMSCLKELRKLTIDVLRD